VKHTHQVDSPPSECAELFRIARQFVIPVVACNHVPRTVTCAQDRLALPVVNGDTGKVLPIAESLNNSLEFLIGAFFEVRFNIFREACTQHLGAAFEFSPLAADFRTHLEER